MVPNRTGKHELELARAMQGNRAAIQAADETLEAARETLEYARFLSERIRDTLGPAALHGWPPRPSDEHDR